MSGSRLHVHPPALIHAFACMRACMRLTLAARWLLPLASDATTPPSSLPPSGRADLAQRGDLGCLRCHDDIESESLTSVLCNSRGRRVCQVGQSIASPLRMNRIADVDLSIHMYIIN
jgi:hypothetical protein